MTTFLQRLGLTMPIIQAPMAGASNAGFVVAACQAGIMGSLGAGMMKPEQINDEINAIKALVQGCFAVNLMILSKRLTDRVIEPMPAWLVQCYKSINQPADIEMPPAPDFAEQLAVLLDNPVPVASFTFGILQASQVDALHAVGTQVIGTANHPDEVLAWIEAGADAVVLQGAEAGGHRGGWLHEQSKPLMLDELWAATKQALATADKSIPLIVAGGIAARQQVQKYLSMGAEAVSVGTAFLTTHEAVIHKAYQARLLSAKACDTALTRLYSGKLARGIITEYMRQFAQFDGLQRHAQIPEYPMLNAMTKKLRAVSTQMHNTEMMSLWAGMGVEHCRDETISQLVARLGCD